jgi:hypothetical protein
LINKKFVLFTQKKIMFSILFVFAIITAQQCPEACTTEILLEASRTKEHANARMAEGNIRTAILEQRTDGLRYAPLANHLYGDFFLHQPPHGSLAISLGADELLQFMLLKPDGTMYTHVLKLQQLPPDLPVPNHH